MNYLAMTLLIILCLLSGASAQSGNLNTEKFQYLSPVPGSELIKPETNIIIRFGEPYLNAEITDTSRIRVTGDSSGKHEGRLYLTDDSRTLIFLPDAPFAKYERITVELTAGLKTIANADVGELKFYFNISGGLPGSSNFVHPAPPDGNTPLSKYPALHSRVPADSSLIFPADFPEVHTTKTSPRDGFYFLAINQATGNYLSIIDNNGFPVFTKLFQKAIYDFKIQPSGILTYFDENKKIFYGLDSLYQVADSFYCKNGYSTDFHDIQVTPDGHSFLISYDPQIINMDKIIAGADTAAVVIGSIIQEINTDKIVIWQWRSWDHFNITDADAGLVDFYQHTIEYSHVNSIDVVDKDRMIISSRVLNEITSIDRNTGNIIWRFGGLKNQFSGNNINFQFQHDARLIGNNKLSLFDNANYLPDVSSRAVVYKIDEQNKIGVPENIIEHTPGLKATNMGNVQYINKSFLVGWGNSGNNRYYMSAFDSTGTILYSDSLLSKTFIYSYRAFKFPWKNKIITADRDSLLFNHPAPNEFSKDSVSVTNNGSEPVNIKGVFYRNSSFTSTESFPLEILPGQKLWLHFNFQDENTARVRDTIYIAASKNDGTSIALPLILIGNANATSVKNENRNLPQEFILENNYPNPFNPATTISYALPVESTVTIKIFNVLGEEVKTLINYLQPAGKYRIVWNAGKYSSGIYFYKFTAVSRSGENIFTEARKMLLVK